MEVLVIEYDQHGKKFDANRPERQETCVELRPNDAPALRAQNSK